MRTETEWAIFAKHVPVGTRVQWRNGDQSYDGTLLENYPHTERAKNANDPASNIDLLDVRFDDTPNEIEHILANYEYFWVWDQWMRFDDILMEDDESLPEYLTNPEALENLASDMFWDIFNTIALEIAYMPNQADDVCEVWA